MHLDDEQQLAVDAPRGPVCILAGAGTGKTRTITHRIGRLITDGQVNPRQIMAVTFTKRAAGEMRERLTHMGVGQFGGEQVTASTFHAAALRQLRFFWPMFMGEIPWTLVDRERFGMVARAAEHCGIDGSKETVRDLLAEIDWSKSVMLDASTYEQGCERYRREAPLAIEKVIAVLRRYEEIKRRSDGILLDFNDLLLLMSAAYEEFPGIQEEFQSTYRSFVVDEYQDVTPLQQRLLDCWLGERDDLTVVGDPNQTIYSFNGASPEYLVHFRRRYPHATYVNLVRDYRSTPEIVQCANKIIGAASGEVSQPSIQLRGQQQSGPRPEIIAYSDDFQEAEEVAQSIADAIAAGENPSETAILYRTNAQSALFEQALEARHVSYQVRGGEGFFQRAEIQQAMRLLAQLTRRDDLPEEAIGPKLVVLVKAALQPLGISEEEPSGAQARERWQSLQALLSLVEDVSAVSPQLTLEGLLRELQQRADNRQPPTVQGVTLSSIHAAKGLEWDRVYVVGVVEGTLPIRRVFDDNAPVDAVEEERRLLYVAVTRARRHLIMTWGEARRAGGKVRKRSRFLDAYAPLPREGQYGAQGLGMHDGSLAGMSGSGTSGGGTGAGGKGSSRRARKAKALEELTYTQQDLYEALKAWRLEQAQERMKPAFTVFSDATLIGICVAAPSTTHELLQVNGVGQAKLELYGEDVLRIVRDTLGR